MRWKRTGSEGVQGDESVLQEDMLTQDTHTHTHTLARTHTHACTHVATEK